jgi:hypothetical protein
LALGKSHGELLEGVDSPEISLWKSRAEIYPFPHEMVCIQIAFLQATFANIAQAVFGKKGGKKFGINDFLLDWKKNYLEQAEEVLEELSDEKILRMEQHLLAVFASIGRPCNVVPENVNHGSK